MTITEEQRKRYGLRPPANDEAKAPKPPAPAATVADPTDHAVIRDKWSKDKKLAFEMLEPACLALVATDGPVSVMLWGNGEVKRRFGHNRGVWPAKIAKSGSWRDTITATYDKNPFFFLGTQFRFWARTYHERDKVADATIELIAQRAEADGGIEKLDHGFADLGPDLDLAMFEFEVHGIAANVFVNGWDDAGLSDFLDRTVERYRGLVAKGYRSNNHPMEAAILYELQALGWA